MAIFVKFHVLTKRTWSDVQVSVVGTAACGHFSPREQHRPQIQQEGAGNSPGGHWGCMLCFSLAPHHQMPCNTGTGSGQSFHLSKLIKT